MFTPKANIRICSRCRTANPARLSLCYGCGNAITDSVLNEEAATYPCLNCSGAVSFRSNSCPHCGRAILPAETVQKNDVPKGWTRQPLPDGSIVLRRSQGTRWRTTSLASLQLPGILAIALGTGLFMPHGLLERGEETAGVLLWVFGACVAICLCGLCIAFLLRENIRVGKDFLEVRRELWWYRFRRRIVAGQLRAKTEQRAIKTLGGGERHSWVRTLYVADAERTFALHDITESVLLRGNGTASPAVTGDQIAQLALYLADITGWQVFDDIAGPDYERLC